MLQHRLVMCVILATTAQAQWLNYTAPGTPLAKDGKPNLTARTPRAADSKPDLSGVWMHEITTAEEMRHLYGAMIDEAIKVDVPGMQIGTQHKYVLNILLDVKPQEGLMRPAAEEKQRRTRAARNPARTCASAPPVFPWQPCCLNRSRLCSRPV
jgi:hypothetical protein